MARSPDGAAEAWFPRPTLPAAPPGSAVVNLLGAVLVGAILYLGADLLVPLALAILLAFALAPPVVWLRRIGLPRVPSVIVVTVLSAMLLAGLGFVITHQLVELAGNLPRYEETLRDKIRLLRDASPSGGVIDRTVATIKDLQEELGNAAEGGDDTVAQSDAGGQIEVVRPVPVEVRDTGTSPVQTILDFLGPVLGPIGTAGLVVVFTVFMLLQREDLRDRAIRLLGGRDLTRATNAMDEAAQRVSRYLLMQLVINVSYGIPYGVGLWLIGVPNAALWGVLATVLRFIPYLGPIIAAFFPLVLAIAVDPGWTMLALTLGLIVGLELVSNNVLEPWLYGASTGLSPVAILVAALFWTVLWGPVGLLLATPLTVCVVVLGRHVPQLNFLEILLGDQPAMPVHARVYQRLLARDLREAGEIAETYLEDHDADRLFDRVLLPAAAEAELARERGALEPDQAGWVAAGIVDLADFLAEPAAPPQGPVRPLLCVGERSELDLAAASLIGRRAAEELPVEPLVVPPTARLADLRALAATPPAAACIARVGHTSTAHVERLRRRLRAAFGAELPVVHLPHDQLTAGGVAAAVAALGSAMQGVKPVSPASAGSA
ncbi:MAG: AI-2E family transporter [Geminicoccaceae bacterium]